MPKSNNPVVELIATLKQIEELRIKQSEYVKMYII